jgi:putative DNA primase/helicase
MMGFINRSVDKKAPNIATAQGQRMIEEHLQEGDFLVLDNLSALCRTPKEDEEGWGSTQEWLIELRHRGITTFMLHHAGKSGAQRGTSKREDFLDAILMMRHPSDYSPDQLLRCEFHVEKYRGDDADAVLPFELRLESDTRGNSVFTHKPLHDIVESRAFEMLKMKMKVNEIAEDLHLSRYQVYRLKRKFDSIGSGF